MVQLEEWYEKAPNLESKDGKPMEGFNAGMKGAKGSADEGGVRVPFFVRWPGKFAADQAVERISAHIDLLPTLADIAGIDQLPKGQVEGRSLVPFLKIQRQSGGIVIFLRRVPDGKPVPNRLIICGSVLQLGTSVFA
jgi:hypothetical protein